MQFCLLQRTSQCTIATVQTSPCSIIGYWLYIYSSCTSTINKCQFSIELCTWNFQWIHQFFNIWECYVENYVCLNWNQQLLLSTLTCMNSSYEFCARYGRPDDRGSKGQIYRCHMPNGDTFSIITITCYESTHDISVQGLLHEHWIDNVLWEIRPKLNTDESYNSSICVQPATSTPFPSHHV